MKYAARGERINGNLLAMLGSLNSSECAAAATRILFIDRTERSHAKRSEVRLGESMNIIKERKKRGAICPRCKHPDYTTHPPVEGETIKPEFHCTACGNSWAYGYDGGMYAELATPDTEVTSK